MTDQHDDLGRYFKPEPGGTEQPPKRCDCHTIDPIGLRQAGTHFSGCPTLSRRIIDVKGSRYAPPSDPWPEIPDAEQETHAAGYARTHGVDPELEYADPQRYHAEIERSRPLLDGSDGERIRLATDAIFLAIRCAGAAVTVGGALLLTQAIVKRLQEPLDS